MRYLLFVWMFAAFVQGAELRTWTDLQDRKIEATMLGLQGEAVLLQLKDGRKVTVALAKLSAADVAFARSQGAASNNNKPASAEQSGFDMPWPDRIKFNEDPEIVVVEQNADEKRFIYESTHYRYICDVRLSKAVVKGFAVMFEATYLFCRSLPLGLDGGKTIDGKLQIRLFEKMEDYKAAGGPPGSAGVFMGGKSEVLVPLDSLGVRPVGSGYMLDRDKSSKTLPHELTHQLTPNPYFGEGARGWFTEGIAEYVAVTPYRAGAFTVRNNHDDIIAYVTGYGTKNNGGRALGKNIRLPDLKTFIFQSYASFTGNAQLNYGGGLLISYYFMQMDGERDAERLQEFLKAMRGGKNGEAALEVLLNGRSFDEMAKQISKAWSRRGIDITFGSDK